MNTNSNLQADRGVRESAIEQAVAVCGSQSELARRCGVTQAHVWYWIKVGHVPAGHCRAVSQATNGRVSIHDLRPDIFSEAPGLQGSEHRRGENKAMDQHLDSNITQLRQELEREFRILRWMLSAQIVLLAVILVIL